MSGVIDMIAKRCIQDGCDRNRVSRHRHCSQHKNYSGAPLPAPPGMKTCRGCRRPQHPECFSRSRVSRDGLQDKCKGCNRVYRQANRQKMVRWRQANVEHISVYNKNWRNKNPEYFPKYFSENSDQYRAHVNKRRARLVESKTVPFTKAQLEDRLAYYGRRCWICDNTASHVDHVKPLSKGGPHILANLRPACSTCNLGKGATWPLTTAVLDRLRRRSAA